MSNANRETHRTRLLQAARTLLREREYGNISARDLVAASGTNLGSIGYHFGSKEQLLNAAIREGCSQWTKQLRQLAFVDAGATPTERLRASWMALTDTFEEHRQLLVAFVELHIQAERSTELRDYLSEIYNEGRAAVARMVHAALGECRDQREPHASTYLIADCRAQRAAAPMAHRPASHSVWPPAHRRAPKHPPCRTLLTSATQCLHFCSHPPPSATYRARPKPRKSP
jgi:AcrR family transcriptional regulator